MASTTSIAFAVSTLTCDGTNATTTKVVVVGGKTYTLQDTLTNVNGNVKIGATVAATMQNLYDAINLTGTPGTQYATAMTANTAVKATSVTATTVVVSSLAPGTQGNLSATTTDDAHLSWTSTVLAGGLGNVNAFITDLLTAGRNQINSEMLTELHKLTIAAD
jgi:hypothetical protein